MAEVSRFSISRHFRRFTTPFSGLGLQRRAIEQFWSSDASLGSSRDCVRMSMQHGTYTLVRTHGAGTLLRMLAAMAIRFKPIGSDGRISRTPSACYIDLSEMLNAVMYERPNFWGMIDGWRRRSGPAERSSAVDSPSRLRSPARALDA